MLTATWISSKTTDDNIELSRCLTNVAESGNWQANNMFDNNGINWDFRDLYHYLFIFVVLVLLRYNWKIKIVYSQGVQHVLGCVCVCVCSKVITAITLCSYLLLCMVKILMFYFLSKFQVYHTLLTIVRMLHIRSPEFIHLITASLYPLTKISLFPTT